MNKLAYVVNSTPRYYYLLNPHFKLLEIYGKLDCPLYIGSEYPDHPYITELNVNCIHLEGKDSGFWESRLATVEKLPPTVKYVLPMQEDFLIERNVNKDELNRILTYMENNPSVMSARLMPCPGPVSTEPVIEKWAQLTEKDDFLFVFQATIWRREAYVLYLQKIIEHANQKYPDLDEGDWNFMAVRENIAENPEGKKIFLKLFKDTVHLAWIRSGKRPNAVYDSIFPYRPTAIVRGKLEAWAKELIHREGLLINNNI